MEIELVERARTGDRAAFEAVIVAASSRLMGIAMGILRDHDAAEDAVQACIVAAWRDLPTLREPERFDAWIGRILVRICVSARRDGQRRHALRVLDVSTPTPDLIRGIADRETLERAFRHLPADQRAVLVYRFYLDLPVERIADELGIPAGTVKSRLHYALTAMRAAIDADTRPSSGEVSA